jgi:hypothetical protein
MPKEIRKIGKISREITAEDLLLVSKNGRNLH